MTLTKKILYTGIMSLTLSGFAATTHAAEGGNKTKEVTELVGYNVKEVQVPLATTNNKKFNRIDKNGDNVISLKEFKQASNHENEYAVFVDMDKDNNKVVSYEELFSFNKTKGNTNVESELHGKKRVKGTNVSTRVFKEKNYFVPIDPVVVDVTPIEKN